MVRQAQLAQEDVADGHIGQLYEPRLHPDHGRRDIGLVARLERDVVLVLDGGLGDRPLDRNSLIAQEHLVRLGHARLDSQPATRTLVVVGIHPISVVTRRQILDQQLSARARRPRALDVGDLVRTLQTNPRTFHALDDLAIVIDRCRVDVLHPE